MENKEQQVEAINAFMIEKVNQAFIMGMNYQKVRSVEKLDELELDGLTDDMKLTISTAIGLLEVSTDADLPALTDE